VEKPCFLGLFLPNCEEMIAETLLRTGVTAWRPLALSQLVLSLLWSSALPAREVASGKVDALPVRGTLALNQPVAVYNNWSAYDELSDNIELTETLAMKELDEIMRLRRAGVRIDYYVMDAFWYSTNGGYRQFRQPNWPNGPDRWLKACQEHQIKPGLWVASNVPFRLEVLPEWRSSMDATGSAMCLFDGGFLPQFMDTLQFWYDRGVRLFKFDFANFTIATPAAAKQFSKAEIIRRNSDALREALQRFKRKNPEVLLAAFNGFGGDTAGTFEPIRQTVDLHWLEAFDSLYCGDPRFADVPAMNVWRSMDFYTDHMVRYYEANGVPLERIDNTGCMFGVAGTCYQRCTSAWKSMLLLEHARGGWMNVYYGNLELIDDNKAKWFAKVQKLYFALQRLGRTFPFGGLPGREEPYGFCSFDGEGALYTVSNPAQSIQTIRLPTLERLQPPVAPGRIQFRDAGFQPRLSGRDLTLGPEQLAVVGYGAYAKPSYDLGVQEDVIIPKAIHPLSVRCAPEGTNTIVATLDAPTTGDIRIVLRQFAGGSPVRSSAGAPPNGTTLAKLLRIEVSQDRRTRPVVLQYDKAIWSGLSWAVGEVRHEELEAGVPVIIRCSSREKQPVELRLECFAVSYK
jgi:hypothetical protein